MSITCSVVSIPRLSGYQFVRCSNKQEPAKTLQFHHGACHCVNVQGEKSFSIRLVFSVESCKMASKTKGQRTCSFTCLILPTLENNVEMAESSSESEFEADFSEEEFTDSDDQRINEAGQIHVVPYMYEPEAESGDSDKRR